MPSPNRSLLIALLLLGVAVTFANADWPHVRGPNYDGVSDERGLADTWPADGPPRLWTRELGQGYSGFIVADGKLYTQRQMIAGQFLLCINPDDGATIWEHRYDWAWQPRGAYPGPYATPTYSLGKVYYASTNGIVGCVNAATGEPVWTVNLRERFKVKDLRFGYAASPLIEDDKVILPVGGPNASLAALHTDDGRTLWTAGTDPASYCPALPITVAGRRCIVGYLENAMILVELATGKLLARQPLSAGYDEHSAWPIWRAPHLLLTGPFRAPATRLELTMNDNGSLACKTNWLSKDLANDVVSTVLFDHHLYGFDLKQLQSSKHRPSRGTFKCLDWDTGKLRWATDDVGHASVLVADGKLILFNDAGTLILANADPTAYREIGRTQLFDGDICWTPPTLWRGKLFVRNPSQMICVYLGQEKQPNQMPTAPNTSTTWKLDPNWLLSREREYPNDAPTWTEMTHWHLACVLVLVIAGALGWVTRSPSVYFGSAILLGIVGAKVLSTLFDQCTFTWPASLYAGFHAAVYAYVAAETRPARWRARLVTLAFLLLMFGYYEACKTIGMFVAWSFLIGFPLALPLAYLAVRASLRQQRASIVAAWTMLAFTLFFWSAQALLLWKAIERSE